MTLSLTGNNQGNICEVVNVLLVDVQQQLRWRCNMNHPSIYPRLLGSVEALLGALEIRDAYSRFHCDRVVRLATELGDECGVLDGELDLLRISARFHDIGKIGIPD